MKINRHVEPLAPQPNGDGHIVSDAPEAAVPGHDDQTIDVGIAAHDRDGRGFDQVCQLSTRILTPQPPQQRRRQHDIADEPQAD